MKKQKGFTLIELLIVVAIMVIMLSVVLSMSRDDRDKQYLRASADQFTSVIREAQNSALTGNLINGERPCSFTVRSSATSYEVFADTYAPDPTDPTVGCGGSTNQNDLVPMRNFEGGTTKKLGQSDLVFGNQFGEVTIVPASAVAAEYVLESANSSLKYTVCVFRSGRVEQRGFGTPGCS